MECVVTVAEDALGALGEIFIHGKGYSFFGVLPSRRVHPFWRVPHLMAADAGSIGVSSRPTPENGCTLSGPLSEY